MKTWGTLRALALLALAGCSQPPSVSGTYLSKDPAGAALLVLTENQQQQIMGSLIIVFLKNGGSTERQDISITGGTVDSRSGSLTLTVKPNALFEQARNVSGSVANGAIDLTMGTSTLHFVPSTQQAFDEVANSLVSSGKMQQQVRAQAQAMAEDVKRISQLTQALAAYNTRIEASPDGPAMVRGQEEKLLAAAQKDLGILKDLVSQGKDYPAGQVRFRIGQLDFQMGQIKFQVDQALNQGRDHIGGFDQRLATSPCNTNTRIEGCDVLGQEKLRYAKVRERVQSNLAQLSGDIQKNGGAMDAINKQAGN